MKKKCVIAAVTGLSVCLTAIGLTGCGNKEETNAEATSFTYWATLPAAIASHVQSYNEVEMYKELEKRTGIHIDFIHPPKGQEREQFSLMLASKEYPDMVEYTWDYNGGAQKAINDNVIIALNDYMDDLPNFQKALTNDSELSEIYRRNSITDSGQYFGFTSLSVGNYRVFSGPLIRRDLLKKYNLDMPETIDDWTHVLTTFKENGISMPLTGTSSYIYTVGTSFSFIGAFGVGGRWYVDNGKMKYGPMEPGYKDYLTIMNQWYRDGLLDRDISTNQGALIDSKILNGNSGALAAGGIGAALGKYLTQKESADSDFDLVGAPYPVLRKGDINEFPCLSFDVDRSVLSITTACKNPKQAAQWADYLYSDEGYMLSSFGAEGKSYNMVDGKPVYTDEILHNPNGLSISEALALNCRPGSPSPSFNQSEDYLRQYYQYDQQKDSFEMWGINTDMGRTHMVPNLFKTEEESSQLASIETDLETYVSEKLWNFISGQEPLDNFDSFVDSLKSQFRIEECINIYQSAYDRYLAK